MTAPNRIPELDALRAAARFALEHVPDDGTEDGTDPQWARDLRTAADEADDYVNGYTRRNVGTCHQCKAHDVERVAYPLVTHVGEPTVTVDADDDRLPELCDSCRWESGNDLRDTFNVVRETNEAFDGLGVEPAETARAFSTVARIAELLGAGGMTPTERFGAILETVRGADCGVYLPPVPAALVGGPGR